MRRLQSATAALSSDSLRIAESAVSAFPSDPSILLLAALSALVAGKPDRALSFIKRVERRCESGKAITLLTALAMARQGHAARAMSLLEVNSSPP